MNLTTPKTRRRSLALGRMFSVLALALCLWVGVTSSGPVLNAASPAAATKAETDEYRLKAAFIYNFARYASWPKGVFKTVDSPIIIAVVGKDPFGKKLEAVIRDRKVSKRPVIFRRYATPSDIKGAHLAILGDLSTKDRGAAIKKLNAGGALVVADRGGTEASGASLGFYLEGSKIRFEVHAGNLKASKIRLGSQLLKLAKIVGRAKR